MPNYIMLHQNRIKVKIGDIVVYCDDFKGNQDPYIWSKNFLNTYCKTSQIKASELKKGDKLFWFSRQGRRSDDRWFVDLVFIVDKVIYWERSDKERNVDGYPFEDHFKWAKFDHPKIGDRPKRRFTIIASKESYQPQTENKELIEIIDSDILELFKHSSCGSKGFKCEEINSEDIKKIENYILENKKIELKGLDLFKLRSNTEFWCGKEILEN